MLPYRILFLLADRLLISVAAELARCFPIVRTVCRSVSGLFAFVLISVAAGLPEKLNNNMSLEIKKHSLSCQFHKFDESMLFHWWCVRIVLVK